MSCHTIIQHLESDNSRLAKEAIVLREAAAGNTEFFDGAKLAFDALITFGVKKVPLHKGPDGAGLPYNVFVDLAGKLQRRELTGNEAKKAIELTMSIATQQEWNDWYRRILIKDLRCGVSEKTINNVVKKKFPQYAVPVFTCQLAHDSTNHESKVVGNKIIEVKLDGVRVLTVVHPTGEVAQYSRNGKELVNFEHIVQQFKAVADQLPEPYVFDGEVMSSSFQDLMKQVHRKENVSASDAVLYLFDMLPLAAFKQGVCQMPQVERSAALTKFYTHNGVFCKLSNVKLVEQVELDLDSAEGKKAFREINQKAIDGGYEGIMIKDPTAFYELKRSVAWLKLKPFIEVTLEAVSVEEGTGKNEGRMGAVLFKGVDDGKEITVSVGGGWTDKDRDDIWSDKASVIGQLGEIRADAITRNQDGTYSLRFPRFKQFRGFTLGEKL
jgi:DNA ligase-1